MQWQSSTHKPKNDSGPQDALTLSPDQVEVVLDVTINEARKLALKVKAEQEGCSTTPTADSDGLKIIKSRVPLIVSCLNTPEKATKAMAYLQAMKIGSCPASESIVKELILQLYMKLPQSLINPSQVLHVSYAGSVRIDGNTSEVDTISHFLLSALASTQHGRSWADQMKEFEAAARKLAATHPLLLLRNLPLLAAGMKGRTDFDFSFFRSRNHMTFYGMALGILELTAPLIFEAKFKKALQDCLECYMTMFKNYFARRDAFSGLTEKVIGFLHVYLNHAPQDASEFVKNHRALLAQYYKAQANSPALTEMSKIIKLDNDAIDDTSSDETTSILVTGSSKFVMNEQSSTQDNAKKLASKLQSAMADENEIVDVLGMIKFCTQTQPGVLPFFIEDFCKLISHEAKIVRNNAYELFVKLLRFDPNLSQQLIVPFIGCLESNDASIAGHAMEKLPDVAPLAQEHLETVLNTAFNLGLYSNLEVINPICDTLTLMNGLAGY